MVLLCALKGMSLANCTRPDRIAERGWAQRPLEEPIVSCALGKLYNKDAILEYLIDKTVYGDGEAICRHIRSLKVGYLVL